MTMENQQLQALGRLLVSGEANALLARELMIGQGIWGAQGVCDVLNAVGGSPREIRDLFPWRWNGRYVLFIDCDKEAIGYHGAPFEDIPKMRYFNFRPKPIFQLETAVNRTPKMLNHHNPTPPTPPVQTTASGPSGS